MNAVHPIRARSQPRFLFGHAVSQGWTLIELMASLAVVAILTAMLLPAVQHIRESARRTSCQNQIRQCAMASLSHVVSQGFYPTGGWGYGWLGDSGRGFGRNQPGGWGFTLLPFLEQQSLFEQGDSAFNRMQLAQTASAPYRCPSRASAQLGPSSSMRPFNSYWVQFVAKTDYAFCEGDFVTDTGPGPISISGADQHTWVNTSRATGVCFQRSQIRARDITRGTSHCMLLGEKFVSSQCFETNVDPGYDQCSFIGVDIDIVRWTLLAPLADSRGSPSLSNARRFGSSHGSGFNHAMCDGSVHFCTYSISPDVFRVMGTRTDDELQ